MKLIKYTLILISTFLPSVASAYGEARWEAEGLSIISLIANPNLYHEKLVRVLGVANIEFEGNTICLSENDYIHGITKNCLWISLDLEKLGANLKDLELWNGSYVIIEGTFNKNNTGHMGLNSGSIENLSRYDKWKW